jgi:hypothetical protein
VSHALVHTYCFVGQRTGGVRPPSGGSARGEFYAPPPYGDFTRQARPAAVWRFSKTSCTAYYLPLRRVVIRRYSGFQASTPGFMYLAPVRRSKHSEQVNEVPEEGRDTTAEGRAIGPPRNDHLAGAGRVSYLLSAVALELTCSKGRRLRKNVSPAKSGHDGRGGRGRGGEGRERDCVAGRTSVTERPEAVTDRRERSDRGTAAVRSRGIQSTHHGEVSPSAGWREVVEAMDAQEGSRHE